MVRILAIADEIDGSLYSDDVRDLEVEAIVACGDLPFDYLEYLVTMAGVPLLYVCGNHDPDLRRMRREPQPADVMKAAFHSVMDYRLPGPEGCTNIDGRVERVGGITFGGLGGSMRYSGGPNQYGEARMGRRAARLTARALLRGGLDVLVTHAAPRGLGDGDDLCHTGFNAHNRTIRRLAPSVLVHGHIHPYGTAQPDRSVGDTRVVNAVPSRVIDLDARTPASEEARRALE